MRAFVPAYELVAPATLREVLELLAREPGVWRPMAGGTDLMVLLEAGRLAHQKFVSIWGLPELRGIEVTPDFVTMGALTTYDEIRADATLRAEFPMLVEAAALTGAVAIQNRGTIGGNVVNASPAADSPPVLLACGAEYELRDVAGARWVFANEFHLDYKRTVLASHELLARVRLPRQKGWREYYRKVGTRKAQSISKVALAARARVEQGQIADPRLAFASVGPTPLRASRTEAVLAGRLVTDLTLISDARAELAREIRPLSDIRSTAAYRMRVAQNLLEDCLRSWV